ncbi:MAG: hypothetical protein Q8J62_02640, partial [Candidatus Cloacimonadaceae bacterium]|nr:hypothetical protein [Candidatus Cloacimonadaceae bacterium]
MITRTITTVILFALILIPLAAIETPDRHRWEITIGAGNQLSAMPMYLNIRNSLFETIYNADEIGVSGIITAISFYNSFINAVPEGSVRIWLGITDWTNMSQGWIPSSQLTQVFDGTLSFPIGENIITLGLNQPFEYTGGNMVMLVQHPWALQIYHNYSYFKTQTIGNNRSRVAAHNTNELDPANPPTPSGPQLSGMFPKTTLHFASQPPQPELFVYPSTHNFGEALLNSVNNRVINLCSTGLEPLVISSIYISGDPCFSLLQVPALPLNLANGQSASFYVHFVPDETGNLAATVSLNANTAQGIHLLPISGTGVDPVIYTLPYSQNFDTATPPALPLGWSAYADPNIGSHWVRTFADAAAPSPPNVARMMNTSPPQGFLILISPPLTENISISTLSVTFWAQSFAEPMAHNLSVGVMTDPANPLSYTEVRSIVLDNSDWNEHTVQFHTYQGGGRYIAFKHPQEWGYISIRLDSIVIEPLADDDLAATWIIGNSFPAVGAESVYQIRVANHGNAAQEDYQVCLMRYDEILLASVPGIPISHGESAVHNVSWIPANEGITELYGKVLLTGDIDPSNDRSAKMKATVLSSGTSAVTIGAGNEQARIPIDLYRRNSLFETVFLATEIGEIGVITGVQFYNNFLTPTILNKPLKIWLGETNERDLRHRWIASTELELVFDGSVGFMPGNDIAVIYFDTAYSYLGGNLVMMVNRPWDMSYYSSSDYFWCQSIGNNRSRNVAGDSVVYNPMAPPQPVLVQLSGQFPKTSFFIRYGDSDIQETTIPFPGRL